MKEPLPQNTVETEPDFEEEFKDFRRREKSYFEKAEGIGRGLCLAFMVISAGVGDAALSKGPGSRRHEGRHSQQASKV